MNKFEQDFCADCGCKLQGKRTTHSHLCLKGLEERETEFREVMVQKYGDSSGSLDDPSLSQSDVTQTEEFWRQYLIDQDEEALENKPHPSNDSLDNLD